MMLIATLAPECNEHHEGMQTEAAVCVCLGVCVRISGLFIHVRVSVCVCVWEAKLRYKEKDTERAVKSFGGVQLKSRDD